MPGYTDTYFRSTIRFYSLLEDVAISKNMSCRSEVFCALRVLLSSLVVAPLGLQSKEVYQP
jgi:hypothetical protein